jgi:hypothetical protein
VQVDEADARPHWCRTGSAYFPFAAQVSGAWWVLRINNFPDHPLWTLFVDGVRRYDIDDLPPAWGNPASRNNPHLDSRTAADVLAPISAFVPYGSEVGQPCDNILCCG